MISNCGTPNEVASPVMNVPVAAVAPEFLYYVQNANGQNPVAAVDFTTGIYVGIARTSSQVQPLPQCTRATSS